MKRVIGITGGIATGKSTVSNYLLSKGFNVIDCDLLTAQSYIDCFDMIKSAFPDCVIDNEISRFLLAKRVFSNENDKFTLESIIHPYVRKKMQEAVEKQKNGLIFLDIPLLYEAHMEDLCDEIWVVYIPRTIQLQRLMKRNQMTEDSAKSRIEAQMDIEDKKNKGDFIFDNRCTIEALYKQVNQRLEELDEYIN